MVAGFVALGAGCYNATAPLGAPCTDDAECPMGQECDPLAQRCSLPSELLVLRDDSAEDFAAPGALIDGVTIEAQGFVGPAAYFTGGVRLTGVAGHGISNLATATFEAAAAAGLHTGSSLSRGFRVEYGIRKPFGVGLPNNQNVTVLVEGEVELDVAGTWGFELNVDDVGFIEIAPPGSTTFTRLVADNDTGTVATYVAAAPGWYRMRGAVANIGQAFDLRLEYDPPNVGGGIRSIPSDRVRVRAGDLTGLAVDGFAEGFLLVHIGSVVNANSLAAQTFGEDPFDLPIGNGNYTLRWSGQVLIATAGDYAFRIDSNQGHRMWIDGTQIADKFSGVSEVSVTAPVSLVAGWHDVVIDVTKADGGPAARLALTVESGPALVGEAFPADHMRPIPGRAARFVANHSGSVITIPDDGTNATRTLGLTLPARAVPRRVDVAVEIEHTALTTVQVALDPPTQANITLADFGTIVAPSPVFLHRVLDTTTSINGFWSFLVADNVAGDVPAGRLTLAAITVVTDGGIEPFATTSRYESAVRELGDVAAFGAVTWRVRQGEPTAATVMLRSCDAPEACPAEPWTPVALDGVPAIAPRRFVQYAFDLATDGNIPTALDSIELAYSARPAQ